MYTSLMVISNDLTSFCPIVFHQVIVEKAERSDIPDIDKKKSVALPCSKLYSVDLQMFIIRTMSEGYTFVTTAGMLFLQTNYFNLT